METWKPIRGFEESYEVSDLGRVRNSNTGKILTPKNHNRGYYHVILMKQGRQKSFLVHRLVALAFIPTENERLTINHIDENKLNNRRDNLEWCSKDENIRLYQKNHPEKVGRPENPTPVRQFTKQGVFIKLWDSVAEVHRQLNYSTWSISQCCNGKRKTAHGYMWQYAT